LYSLSVINSFVEFSGGSICYTDRKMIKLQGNGKKRMEDGGMEDGGKEDGGCD
jgi:hypothetical protein